MSHRYHVECFTEEGQRIGGFAVRADTIGEALQKASSNIELALRPNQPRVTVTRLPLDEADKLTVK